MKHAKLKQLLGILALALGLILMPVMNKGVYAEESEGQTLTSDVEINGDFVLLKGDLILGDNTLTVNGDFIMKNGRLVIGKGSLIVSGDMHIQRPMDDGTWSWSDGALQMDDPEGYIEVAGSFVTSSTANYSSTTPNNILTAGTIAVGGDFRQEHYGYNNDAFASEGVRVVMNGTGVQHIRFDKPFDSYFYDLSLENTNIVVDTMISGFNMTEDVNFANGLPKGICRTMYINGYKLSVGGDMILGDKNTGDSAITGKIDVGGGELVIDGNLLQEHGTMFVNGGSVSIGGNYRVQRHLDSGYSWSDGCIVMKDENDLISVEGSFITSSTANYSSTTPNNELSAGTIEVGGDFRQEHFGYNNDAFASTGTKVIMNGDEKTTQVIKFDKPFDSYFHELILENSNIKVESMIRGFKLTENLTFNNDMAFGTCGTFDLNGKTLTIKGDMMMGARDSGDTSEWGNINVNGGTLTVGGNLLQEKGVMNIANGKVNIGKDYRIQRKMVDGDGNVSYSWSDGSLAMNDAKGTLTVGGSFITSSTANYSSTTPNNSLTAGNMYVGGDFRQEHYGYNNDAFPDNGVTVTLNGTKKQTVKFDKPYDSYFYDLILVNTDIEIASMIKGWKLTTDTTFGNGIPYGTCGTFDLNGKTMNLNGNLVMGDRDQGDTTIYGSINVNKGKLIVSGNMRQEKGALTVGGGTVYVGGDYRIQRLIDEKKGEYSWSDGALIMNNAKDLLVVKGSFYTSSTANYSSTTPSNDISAGTMEVGGDFRQEHYGYNNDAFKATDNHTVILNGTGTTIQNVVFDKYPDSKINNLILTRESKYYKFSPSLSYNHVETDEDYTSKYNSKDSSDSGNKDSGKDNNESGTGKSYTITFNPNGGKITKGNKKATISGSFSNEFPTVTRKGYTLKGWYSKKSGGTEVKAGTKVTKSITVYARWTKVSKPSKTSIKSISAQSKGFKVTWKRVTGISGYEIRYATKSNMKGYKALAVSSSDTSATVSKLSASKKYYVVVYAFTTDSAGNKVYSKVSNKKSVKTKK